MKIDLEAFFKCFSVFSRDIKEGEFDVILNTKMKYFSNHYKNELINFTDSCFTSPQTTLPTVYISQRLETHY